MIVFRGRTPNSYQVILMSTVVEFSLPHGDTPDLLDTAVAFYYK